MKHEIRVGRMRRDRGISVARPSPLGNPFLIGKDGDRAEVIAKYRAWFAAGVQHDPLVKSAVCAIVAAAEEGDVTLLCWCAPEPCHAEVIAGFVRAALAGDVAAAAWLAGVVAQAAADRGSAPFPKP